MAQQHKDANKEGIFANDNTKKVVLLQDASQGCSTVWSNDSWSSTIWSTTIWPTVPLGLGPFGLLYHLVYWVVLPPPIQLELLV